jgi:glycosyltransferase involved in cell wall biosynthesis
MAERPFRLTFLLTHPVQYFAPWFRYIHSHVPDVALTVLYGTKPSSTAQAAGFGGAFQWDRELLDGYDAKVLAASGNARVSADRFSRLDVPRVGQAIEDTEPDAVLIPGWHAALYLRAIRECRQRGIPIIYRGDSTLSSGPAGWRRSLWRARTRWLLHQYDRFLAVGILARAYVEHFGASESHVFDSPHAVDNDTFSREAAAFTAPVPRSILRQQLGIAPNAFVVLLAGKLTPGKRPFDAVDAVAQVGNGATLLVAGAGELESACRGRAAAAGLEARWMGFVNQLRMPSIYAAADCLVLPSQRETWGLVVNEAMAVGIPSVISHTVGCAPDLIDEGVTGYIASAGDVPAIAASLRTIRERLAAGERFGAACRAQAAKHSFARASAGLVAACASLRHRTPSVAVVRQSRPQVLVLGEYLVTLGGLERMTGEVVRLLRSSGADVHWLLNDWDSARIAAMARRLDSTWSYGHFRVQMRRHARSPLHWLRLLCDVAASNLIVWRQTRRLQTTHVFLPDYLTVLRHAPVLLTLRQRDVRTILRLGVAPPAGEFYRRVFKWVIDAAVDRYVCNSTFTQRELHALGVGNGKSRVIQNVAPSRTLATQRSGIRDPRRIVFVGQLIPQKGPQLLLDALALLAARGLSFTADFVGDLTRWEPPQYAGFRSRLLERAAAPNLAGHVRFLGMREDVPAILSASGIHVCPSAAEIREAFGLTVLEAKIQGVPSIVFPSGALPELVEHGVTGWICQSFTAEALAEGLEYYLRFPLVRARQGQAAAKSASLFHRAQFDSAWCEEFGTTLPYVRSVRAAACRRVETHG